MGEISFGDTDKTRYIVWRYGYDLSRKQRRNIVEIVFDNAVEFEEYLQAADPAAVDPPVQRFGTVLKPGQQNHDK